MNNNFVRVAETKDIKPSEMLAVEVEREESVCIANIDGKYYAIGNVLPMRVVLLQMEHLTVMKSNVHGMVPNLILGQVK